MPRTGTAAPVEAAAPCGALTMSFELLLPLLQQLLRAARRPDQGHRFSEAMNAPERTSARDVAGPVAPTPTARRSARRQTVVAGLSNPCGLRRAIVLMTILGPCRRANCNRLVLKREGEQQDNSRPPASTEGAPSGTRLSSAVRWR